jgi:hypothetical protein
VVDLSPDSNECATNYPAAAGGVFGAESKHSRWDKKATANWPSALDNSTPLVECVYCGLHVMSSSVHERRLRFLPPAPLQQMSDAGLPPLRPDCLAHAAASVTNAADLEALATKYGILPNATNFSKADAPLLHISEGDFYHMIAQQQQQQVQKQQQRQQQVKRKHVGGGSSGGGGVSSASKKKNKYIKQQAYKRSKHR